MYRMTTEWPSLAAQCGEKTGRVSVLTLITKLLDGLRTGTSVDGTNLKKSYTARRRHQ